MGLLVILCNILKIIGFIVLFIVLLLLLMIALVLFSPICYKVAGSYTENISGEFDVKWIFGAIHAYGMYEEELKISLKLFGYCIYGADKKQKKNKEKIEYTQEDTVLSARSKQEQQKETIPQQKEQQVEKESEINENKETEIKIETKEMQQQQKENTENKKQKHSRKKVSDIKIDKKQKKQRKSKKIKHKNEKHKKQKIDKSYFLHMENKKELLQAIVKFCKRMLKGVLPKDCCLKATVGTGDPALTGYILGIAGAVKMKFGKRVQITGDFTQKILKDVFLDVKGKILLGYLLYAVLRLVFVKPVYKTIMVIWKGYR